VRISPYPVCPLLFEEQDHEWGWITLPMFHVDAAGPVVFHALPTLDDRPHQLDEECWCHPVYVDEGRGAMCLVHNSWDGREFYESGERKPH